MRTQRKIKNHDLDCIVIAIAATSTYLTILPYNNSDRENDNSSKPCNTQKYKKFCFHKVGLIFHEWH